MYELNCVNFYFIDSYILSSEGARVLVQFILEHKFIDPLDIVLANISAQYPGRYYASVPLFVHQPSKQPRIPYGRASDVRGFTQIKKRR